MKSRSRNLKRSVRRRSSNRKRSAKFSNRKKGCSLGGKKLKLLSIKRSPKKDKKYVATFCRSGRIKQTHFGYKTMQNYGGVGSERHLSLQRKKNYISRHRSRENWNDPTSAGALSRWVLWNKTTLQASIADYKRRFKL